MARMIHHVFVCFYSWRRAEQMQEYAAWNFPCSYLEGPDFEKPISGMQILARIIFHGFVCFLFVKEARRSA
jgi:hypothetical protein